MRSENVVLDNDILEPEAAGMSNKKHLMIVYSCGRHGSLPF